MVVQQIKLLNHSTKVYNQISTSFCCKRRSCLFYLKLIISLGCNNIIYLNDYFNAMKVVIKMDIKSKFKRYKFNCEVLIKSNVEQKFREKA